MQTNIFQNVNKNIGLLCERVYLFMVYYALLAQMFEHLPLLNNIVIIMYHNALITSYLQNRASKVKTSKIKESVSVYCLLVSCSKYAVNFSKIHI